MIARWLIIFLLTLTCAFSQGTSNPAFEYGPRPPLPVFDPTSILTPDEAVKIAQPMEDLRRKEGVDVFTVVLPDLGEAPPEHVAKRFADAWGNPDIHAIVLYTPNTKGSPWIIPGGKVISLIKQELIKKSVADAQRRASLQPTPSGKVRAATEEAADLLRMWTGSAVTHGENVRDWRNTLLTQRSERIQRWKYIALAVGCSIIPLFFLGWKIRSHLAGKAPLRFPQPTYSRRLGAPFCGGNSASLDLETSSGKS